MHTPDKALEAMAAPAPLTMGQVALLDLYKCPILDLKYDDVSATAFALWLLDMPLEQAVVEAHFPEKAIAWAESVGVDGYQARLVSAFNAIGAFYGMLPKAESEDDGEDGDGVKGLKKKSADAATATLPKSSNSFAAPMAGRFATFFRKLLQSRWRSSTAAGCRRPEA